MGLKATFWPVLRSTLFTLAAPVESPPQRGINRQTAAKARREVDETAVVADFPVPKQPCQQGQGVLGKGWVDEWLLPFQGSGSATTWFIIIQGWIANLGK